ncbi:proteasome-type protease [Aquisalimonas sp.]|uniref:proteasome-type protease n=1 Tax=Aquisalimonas sp. TaxID=1872621 RepID=UPI0025BC4950|nr:proteasome-type protease [Aquisalimonas sp.]
MTYCLAAAVDAGLVFAADSRTNAGLDHINTYPKLHPFIWEGDRVFVLLSAGNLATTQAVVTEMQRNAESGGALSEARFLPEAAQYVGEVSRRVQARHAPEGPGAGNVSLEASFILGGQIGNQEPGLFLIYPRGNFITCSQEQPFLQIGETKYGKPILDRIISPSLSLEDTVRCALVSIDSTMRSNLSVGPPLDLMIYPKDTLERPRALRYKLNSPYFASIRKRWSDGLRRLFDDLPRFDWE